MADIPPPNPTPVASGAVQPPKKETGKVQPKKETVRINLPPKPTAAPTIKLPTLPPGGPTGAPSPASAATPAPALKTSAAAPAAAAPAKPTAATIAPAASRPAATRPAAATAAKTPTINALDKALIFSAAIANIAAIIFVAWGFHDLMKEIKNFQP